MRHRQPQIFTKPLAPFSGTTSEGALDYFFEVCDTKDRVVLADMGAGAGIATVDWFAKMFEDSVEMNIHFTTIGVTTNDPGAVLSILKWGRHLQDRADYLIVLNALRFSDEKFEFWHEDESVKKFIDAFDPCVMATDARVPEFQSELRNAELSLDAVTSGRTDSPFFKKTMQLVRARRYQRNLYAGFDTAAEILIP